MQIMYDPDKVDYQTLLQVFWHNVDPTAKIRQFCDRGNQYRTAIFYHNQKQKRAAETFRSEIENSKSFDGPIVTVFTEASTFYPAEDHHQYYYIKIRYATNSIVFSCGRDKRLETLWGECLMRFRVSLIDVLVGCIDTGHQDRQKNDISKHQRYACNHH